MIFQFAKSLQLLLPHQNDCCSRFPDCLAKFPQVSHVYLLLEAGKLSYSPMQLVHLFLFTYPNFHRFLISLSFRLAPGVSNVLTMRRLNLVGLLLPAVKIQKPFYVIKVRLPNLYFQFSLMKYFLTITIEIGCWY